MAPGRPDGRGAVLMVGRGCGLLILWAICWVLAGIIAAVTLASHTTGGLLAAFILWAFVPAMAVAGWLWGRAHP